MPVIIALPDKVQFIIGVLKRAGYEAYAVGGCVRDSVLGRTPQDWDITTSASPGRIKELFARTVDTGIRHGTVTVLEGGEGFEVTTYRIDGEYEDFRHPKEVTFTSDLEEDLRRRDFTINAMAYNEDEGLIDLFGGVRDLQEGVIRCVGNPRDRFMEDALRMMRAVRFAAQLDFAVAKDTRAAISELAPNLAGISVERIQAEFVKLLMSGHPEEIRTVYETGMSRVFLPEFDEMMRTPQNHPYHCFNVGEHTIAAMQNIRPDKVLRLTMLFHDVAKPVCCSMDENGICHFFGHAKKSAQMAEKIMRRMKFDNDTIARTTALILWHDDMPVLQERQVRHAIHRTGTAQYPALFAVQRADALAKSEHRRTEQLEAIRAYEKLYEEIMAKRQCLTLRELALTGKDLIALGMRPGREIGDMLHVLLMHVLDCPEDNMPEILRNLVKTKQKSE